MTPSLPAAQPATFTFEGREDSAARQGDRQGLRADRRSMTRKSQAILDYRVSDLVLGPGQDGRVIQPEGIRASALTPAQQTMLLEIVREWAGIMADGYADARMAEIRAKLADTWFAWSETDDEASGAAYFRDPGADAGHRIRAAGRRQSHPHDLSRSDQ